MARQFSISGPILWMFVILIGIGIGGGIYETRVIVPMWASSPPESVIAFYQHNVANPAFAPNQGGRFWIYITPLGALVTVATLISAYWTSGAHRRWRVVAGASALIGFVLTFAWFVPKIMLLMGSGVVTMSPDEVAATANAWVDYGWVRFGLLSAAWLAGLRAMTLPPRS